MPIRLPGWVFRPVTFGKGPAGWCSTSVSGGIRLMTSPMEPLEDGRYESCCCCSARTDVEPNDDEQMYFSNAIVERA